MVVGTFQKSRLSLQKHDKQWSAVFPPEQKTEEDCLLFISRMSYIALAEYLLSRDIVSPKIFKRRRIGDVIFHTFNKDFRWGSKLSDMMRGIGEAIKLKYARQAFIMINEDEEDHDLATEVFTMSFAYNEDDCFKLADANGNSVVSMGYKGSDALRKQVAYLIQKITAVCNGLNKFNSPVFPYIKLTYYDERTPPDYQPFAFQHSDTTFIFKVIPPRFEFGAVSTNFAASAIDIQSIYIDNVDLLEEANCLGVDYHGNNSLDVTVDGDITINEPSNMELNEDAQRSDSLEFARHDNAQDIDLENVRMTYNSGAELQDESFIGSESNTTNDEEYPPKFDNKTRKRGAATVQKQHKKSSIKKTIPTKAVTEKRKTRSRKAQSLAEEVTEHLELQGQPAVEDNRLAQDEAGMVADESVDAMTSTWHLNKISKAFTSPNHHTVSPNHRRMATAQFFKTSVVSRTIDQSPSDKELD